MHIKPLCSVQYQGTYAVRIYVVSCLPDSFINITQTAVHMLGKLSALLKMIVTFPYNLLVSIIGFVMVLPPVIIMVVINPSLLHVTINSVIASINRIRSYKKKVLDISEKDEIASIVIFSAESSKTILFYLMMAVIIKLYFFGS